MADLPRSGPLAERHLSDEARLGPMHARPPHGAAVERRPWANHAREGPGEFGQGGLVETRADLPRIRELPSRS